MIMPASTIMGAQEEEIKVDDKKLNGSSKSGEPNTTSPAVTKLIDQARQITARMKALDSETDDLTCQAYKLSHKIASMKELREDLALLSQKAHDPPKSSLIMTMQRESKQLRKLEEDNLNLKCSLEENRLAIELIMSKYRQRICTLMTRSSASAAATNHQQLNGPSTDIIPELCQHYTQLTQMGDTMRQAAAIDDEKAQENVRRRAELVIENEGLRELYHFSKQFGSTTSGSSQVTKQSEATELANPSIKQEKTEP